MDEIDIYHCDGCSYSTTGKDLFETHIQIHNNGKELYFCKYCGDIFEDIISLKIHELRIKKLLKCNPTARLRPIQLKI